MDETAHTNQERFHYGDLLSRCFSLNCEILQYIQRLYTVFRKHLACLLLPNAAFFCRTTFAVRAFAEGDCLNIASFRVDTAAGGLPCAQVYLFFSASQGTFSLRLISAWPFRIENESHLAIRDRYVLAFLPF